MAAPSPGRSGARGAPARVLSSLAGGPPSWAFGAHLASLGIALAVLAWLGRPLWFFGDEWDFLVNRGGFHQPHLGLWDPHAHTHWSTAPILIYHWLFALFGLRHYAPYLGVNLILHVVIAYLLWRVMRRVGVPPWVATGLAAVFLVLGGGEENIFWAFQITMNGSVLLGLAHLLLVDRDGSYGRRDVLAAVTALVALLFSGVAVTMIAVSVLVVLLRRGRRLAALTAAPPALAYLIWYVVKARHDPNRAPATPIGSGGPLVRVADFWWTGLSHLPEAVLGRSGLVGLLLAGFAVWIARRVRPTRATPPDRLRAGLPWGPRQWPAVTLAAAVPLLFVLLSVGRADFGDAFATASRYVYIATAMLLPALGLLVGEVTARGWPGRTTAALLIVAIGWYGVSQLLVARDIRIDKEVRARGQILAAGELLASGAPTNALAVEPEFSPDLRAGDVLALQRRGALPPVGDLSAFTRLRAAAALQLLITPDPDTYLGPGAALISAEKATASPPIGGCVTLTPAEPNPTVLLDFPSAGAVTVLSEAGGALAARLDPAGPVGPSQPRPGVAPAGRPVWVSVARADPVLLTLPDKGQSLICRLTG